MGGAARLAEITSDTHVYWSGGCAFGEHDELGFDSGEVMSVFALFCDGCSSLLQCMCSSACEFLPCSNPSGVSHQLFSDVVPGQLLLEFDLEWIGVPYHVSACAADLRKAHPMYLGGLGLNDLSALGLVIDCVLAQPRCMRKYVAARRGLQTLGHGQLDEVCNLLELSFSWVELKRAMIHKKGRRSHQEDSARLPVSPV
jgi:hypothetical protein